MDCVAVGTAGRVLRTVDLRLREPVPVVHRVDVVRNLRVGEPVGVRGESALVVRQLDRLSAALAAKRACRQARSRSSTDWGATAQVRKVECGRTVASSPGRADSCEQRRICRAAYCRAVAYEPAVRRGCPGEHLDDSGHRLREVSRSERPLLAIVR